MTFPSSRPFRTSRRHTDRGCRPWRLATLVLLTACGSGAIKPTSQPHPEAPAVTPTVPAESDVPASEPAGDATADIERFEGQLEAHPNQWPVWAQLGEAYLRRARSHGDVADYDRASRALERSISIQQNQEATRWLAAVRLDQHRFDEAAKLADDALAAWDVDGVARAVLTDALLAMGKYDEARTIVEQAGLEGKDFYSIVGYSRWLFLTGKVGESIEQLERALDLLDAEMARQGRVPALDRAKAWCNLMIGGYHYELDQPEQALAHYKASLALDPRSPDAIEHRAEWEAEYGTKSKAVAMYRDVLEAHPRPHEMVALAELLIATGAAEEGRTWLGRAEQVWVDRLDRGDVSVRRELAMLWLDHGGDEARALELARADLTLRKDALAYDTLAWALHRNGQRGEAEKAMRTAMQYGTRMRVLSEHAQAILGG